MGSAAGMAGSAAGPAAVVAKAAMEEVSATPRPP